MSVQDGYRIVPTLPAYEERGIQCGKCGMRFDHGKAYAFYCADNYCPVQPKATCGGTTFTMDRTP